jgi:hypothetical protein
VSSRSRSEPSKEVEKADAGLDTVRCKHCMILESMWTPPTMETLHAKSLTEVRKVAKFRLESFGMKFMLHES